MSSYVGRFAPSPTGPLHLGSLYAGLASYLDARANNGKWLIRMEDIDPPREIQGAADTILHQLENHGLHWDDQVLYQSQRLASYEAAMQTLRDKGLVYPCQCSRARLRSLNGVYDGQCRSRQMLRSTARANEVGAIRVKAPETTIHWLDIIQGRCSFELSSTCGDFVIVRKDGLVAYQLAVSVDDAYQNITHVIRGDDLRESTPRQIHLLRQLDLEVPNYGHISVIKNRQGDKLSKQSFAPALRSSTPGANIEQCLMLLGIDIPEDLTGATVGELLQWAIRHWTISPVLRASKLLDEGQNVRENSRES